MLLSSLLLLAGSTLIVGAAVPGTAVPDEAVQLAHLDEWVRNHTSGQWRHKSKYETIALVPGNPLLFPLGNVTDPNYVETLRVALHAMISTQKELLHLVPFLCNAFAQSIATWQAMVDKLESKAAPLLKSDYINALEALGKAADHRTLCGRIREPKAKLIRDHFSDLVGHHIRVVERLSFASAYDSAPSYFIDRPWQILVSLLRHA